MVAVIGDSAQLRLHHACTAAPASRFCGTIHSVGYKFGRWLDSVIMELPLGEGDTSAPPSGARTRAERIPASRRG